MTKALPQIWADRDLNVNRFEKKVCGPDTIHLRIVSRAAYNN